ncbi:MAG: hypothetical protein CVU55_01655 [Deltaproteobacteria bacterium HGW-Deltaproteobacteria-13]|nr:MAG: hypothetical protein CVU55_01655 [Deltaproteobacteria bacterium HGW-Deltaproteobacteria-13]
MQKKCLCILIIVFNLIISSPVFADETSTFTSQKPDVLIVLDGSGSMVYEPSGADCKNISSTNYSCNNHVYGNANCDNTSFGDYSSTNSERNTDCRKISIARRALGKILDDQKAKQRVRMGFMGYTNCGSNSQETFGTATSARSGGSYNPTYNYGCNYIRNDISDSYTDSTTNIFESIRTNINNFAVTGGTVLVASLAEAKQYFQNYTDNAKSCRTKFVILITDGDETFACPNASGNDLPSDQYKRRRESVAAAKALYDTFAASTDANLKDQKVKMFVIGFGTKMPDWSENTLNWMSYYGHTSFSQAHTGDPNSYSLDVNSATDLYPYNSVNKKITACDTKNSTAVTSYDSSKCCDSWGRNCNCCDNNHPGCVNADIKTDPGRNKLTGYAFLAANATQLDAALASAMKVIESTYAFATSSVQSVRTKDENYIYEASFTVRSNDPFYVGHLKQYTINTDGSIPTDFQWDAGQVLKSNTSRNIWTYKNGSSVAFNTSNISYLDLSVGDATAAGNVITFFRDGDITTNDDDNNQWKLGDTFHSYPVTVGTPSIYFYDKVDISSPKAFEKFREDHPRDTLNAIKPWANKNRMIVTGANDGQLHMFDTTYGAEKWSFIPPNLLSQLQYIFHQSHPDTTQSHTYFVDGPISISDVWLPDGSSTIRIAKSGGWKTYMVFSEGRGAKNALWSKSPSCEKDLSPYYSDTNKYYCGYYAFDLTDVTYANPTPVGPKWILGGPLGLISSSISSNDAVYLGEPWSKMIMGRVRNNGNEQWVGLFGGGYSDCLTTTNSSCATRGKGFFVIDLKTGLIIKRFSDANNLTMSYQLAGAPGAIDSDNDGFVDTVYMGDLGNDIWRFKLCLEVDDSESTKCGSSTSGKWISTALLSSSTHYRQIYTAPSVTMDNSGNMWVYVGTGDKMNPTATGKSYKDRFYAIIDNDRSSTWTLSNLTNITSSTFNMSTDSNHGWYIELSIGDGEKILTDPVVFQGVVYFTTYVPASGTDVCNKSGSAYLYAIDYITGAGKYASNTPRYDFIGYGIPSSPIVSVNPYGGTDVYVSTSQKNTQTLDTFVKKQNTPTMQNYNRTNLMMWRDRRVE